MRSLLRLLFGVIIVAAGLALVPDQIWAWLRTTLPLEAISQTINQTLEPVVNFVRETTGLDLVQLWQGLHQVAQNIFNQLLSNLPK